MARWPNRFDLETIRSGRQPSHQRRHRKTNRPSETQLCDLHFRTPHSRLVRRYTTDDSATTNFGRPTNFSLVLDKRHQRGSRELLPAMGRRSSVFGTLDFRASIPQSPDSPHLQPPKGQLGRSRQLPSHPRNRR